MSASALGDSLQAAAAVLQAAGVDSPRLDAELLLAYCLGVPRDYVLAHRPDPLAEPQQERYRALVARRAAREPLAYITGERWFYGLRLEVTPAVLIPRPETEMVVEAALAWLRARPSRPRRLADIGVGSGAIAVAVAVRTAGAALTIYATDASPEALAVARRNAGRHQVAGRITFLQGDLLAPLPEPVDLILANLPYVAETDRPALMPEVRDFEPAAALFAGPDGMDAIERLLAQAPAHLVPGAALFLEIGWNQGQAALAAAHRSFPAATIAVLPDLAGNDRLLTVQLP